MIRIEIVRHAQAVARSDWSEADRQRPLTDRGRAQSTAIADQIGAAPGTRLIASPFTRCLQTLEPLAERLGTTITHDERLGETDQVVAHDAGDRWVIAAWLGGRALAAIDEAIGTAPDGSCVVVCSHGDVLPALLAVVVGRDGIALEDVHLKKGARFTIDVHDGRATSAVAVPVPEV